jgi:thioredoxin-related protein
MKIIVKALDYIIHFKVNRLYLYSLFLFLALTSSLAGCSNYKDNIKYDYNLSLKEALEISEEKQKPVLAIFISYATETQRKIEILKENEIYKIIKSNYTFVFLNMDDKSPYNLNENTKYNLMSDYYNDILHNFFRRNVDPVYAVFDSNEKPRKRCFGYAGSSNKEEFLKFLEEEKEFR